MTSKDGADRLSSFATLQESLGSVYALNSAESAASHVMVLMPSFSIGEGLLSHYASRLVALEHRFLVGVMVLRMPATRLLYICSGEPDASVIDHYFSLLPDELEARQRFKLVVVDDPSGRPVAAKLLDRPDLLETITAWIGDDPAFIEPWNVAEPERELALRLQLPIFGSAPEVWPLGFKSAGRKLFRQAGIPIAPGLEDLTTAAEAVQAIEQLRAADPELPAVILKHDDSGAGDGNAVIRTHDLEPPGSRIARGRLSSRVNSLASWYLDTLDQGFVAESRIVGDEFSSPSAQVEIQPDGSVVVISTHDQILGDDGQVYLGCRFPADPAYSAGLAEHARVAAQALADRGGLGRLGVDFVTARTGDGAWSTYAIEINLRKPGTTHPFSVLRHLAPGGYDAESGTYLDDRGRPKFYVASDNLVDESWTGIAEADVIGALGRVGIGFDKSTRTGVVPHMLSCLAIDGRFGITAIGDSAAHAQELEAATAAMMHEIAGSYD